jgi:hypothetical protein
VKPKFTIIDPTGGITVSGDGSILTQSIGKNQHCFALLTPQISARSPPSYLKIRIHVSTHSSNWLLLGVIGKTNPANSYSYGDPTCYGWVGHSDKQVYIAGANKSGHDGFTDHQQGDVVVLKLDTSSHTFKMHNSRLARVFTISGLPDIPYWFHVNLYSSGNQVEVLDVTPSDVALF